MGLNDDPVASATRGAVRGALDWTKDQVVELVKKFRNRKLAFVQSEETVSLILNERRREEWTILKRLLKDKDLRIQASLGLALRRLERDPEETERLHALRKKNPREVRHGRPTSSRAGSKRCCWNLPREISERLRT